MSPWLARALRDSAELRSALPGDRPAVLARIAATNGSSPLTVRTYAAIARRYERLRHRDPEFAAACQGMPIPLLKKASSIHERSPSAARRIADEWRAGIVNSCTPYIGSSRGDRRSLSRIEDLEYRLEEAKAALSSRKGRGSGDAGDRNLPLELARAIQSAESRQTELERMRDLCQRLLADNASLKAENAGLRSSAKASKASSSALARKLRTAYRNGMSPPQGTGPAERAAALLAAIAGILADAS